MPLRHTVLEGAMAIEAPYSHVVDDGTFVFVAGQLAHDHPDWDGRSGTIEDETEAALDLIARALATSGLDFGHVVRVGVYMTDLAEFVRMNTVYARHFSAGRRPARTCVGVAALLAGARIEIDCIARRP